MNKRFTALAAAVEFTLALTLCAGSAKAQDLGYQSGGSGYAAIFQNQIVVTTTVPTTYYSLVANQVGYGGIQMQGTTSAKVGIFSLWDQGSSPATNYAYNANLNIQANGRFGGEGTGVQFIFNYPWNYGTAYRSALRTYVEGDGANVRFSGFFYDSSVGAWTYIVTQRVNTAGETLHIPNLYSFAEDYGGTYGQRQATISNAWYYVAGTGWGELTSGSVSNTTQQSTDYSEVLTSSSGFEFYSNSNITPQAVGSVVSYSAPSSDAPIVVPFYLSCGNTNAEGNWEPDGYWVDNAGNSSANAVGPTVSTSAIANPAPQAVYQAYRTGSNFQYNLFGFLPNQTYALNLQFVEAQATASGQRLQNVSVNGQAVLSNFDIFASAGGQNKAILQSFNVTSNAEGALAVSFSAAAGSTYPAAVTAIAAGPGSANGALANGTYTVTNASSGLVWDDPGSSKQQGTDVIVYAATGNPNQSWTFSALGNGYYKIVNAYSGLSLNDPASSLSAGTLLIQYPFQNTSNEYWLLTPSGSGYVITSKASGLAVDPNANTSGSDIRQETANGTSSQVWIVR